MKRRTAREKALQAIFQIDISQTTTEDALEHVLEGNPSDHYLNRLVTGVVEHIEAIDAHITKHLEKWTLERLAHVDRNLLRLSVYELLYCQDDVPVNVVIDEAVEIAKIYGDEQSSKFINGVLSNVKNTLQESSRES
ncbi:transcription antitermination factor NusB [Bacillus sp. V3B]|uniref:transcription antitermination factor NusB n=1 Tax=Bacillus sp. V3B TaxID=2804915 RepID=UPI00210A0CF9|nr:transcription antitermination factor NusB [Bacillus sp. V3B]MCQ6273748.1 transcription antitermination factor NusB [Bacillus sp. V3B]